MNDIDKPSAYLRRAAETITKHGGIETEYSVIIPGGNPRDLFSRIRYRLFLVFPEGCDHCDTTEQVCFQSTDVHDIIRRAWNFFRDPEFLNDEEETERFSQAKNDALAEKLISMLEEARRSDILFGTNQPVEEENPSKNC